MNSRVPHLRVVVSVTAFVLIGFAVVSGYVLVVSHDEVTKGNIIGTWQNFALLAVGFWIGSSSGGKASSNPDEPQSVTVNQPANDPIPTTNIPSPEFGGKP